MPQFRCLKRCFVDNTLREKGEIIEYNGRPYRFLAPLDVKEPEPIAEQPGESPEPVAEVAEKAPQTKPKRKPGRPRKNA